MQQEKVTQHQQHLTCATMPLAIYREVAAHLRQIEGVNTGLLEQQSQRFNYFQSQVRGIWIEHPQPLPTDSQEQMEIILDHYAQSYGLWQTLELKS